MGPHEKDLQEVGCLYTFFRLDEFLCDTGMEKMGGFGHESSNVGLFLKGTRLFS